MTAIMRQLVDGDPPAPRPVDKHAILSALLVCGNYILIYIYTVLGKLSNQLHITYYLQLNYLVTVTYYP